jgi:hypothetical protein
MPLPAWTGRGRRKGPSLSFEVPDDILDHLVKLEMKETPCCRPAAHSSLSPSSPPFLWSSLR